MSVLKRISKSPLGKCNAALFPYRIIVLIQYLRKAGWFQSAAKSMPVDAKGNERPWYTYSFMSFLEARILPTMRVFEYGSGNSTIWWSSRVASVVACEHDESWFKVLSQKLPKSVDYRYCELERDGKYCKLITNFSNEFDCIVIDGRDRVNCAKNALSALKRNGVIIWDDTERDCYQDGYRFLLDNGFRQIDFWGLGPINGFQSCTSVFYRSENCMLI